MLVMCAIIKVSKLSPSLQILSSALSVSATHPDKTSDCILGACATIPAIASSVIFVQYPKSNIRRFSAVCRRIRGGRSSSQVMGVGGRGFSVSDSLVASTADGNALSGSNEQRANRKVRSFRENNHKSRTGTAVRSGKSHNSSSTRREQDLAMAQTDGSVIPATPFRWIHSSGNDFAVSSRIPTSVTCLHPVRSMPCRLMALHASWTIVLSVVSDMPDKSMECRWIRLLENKMSGSSTFSSGSWKAVDYPFGVLDQRCHFECIVSM